MLKRCIRSGVGLRLNSIPKGGVDTVPGRPGHRVAVPMAPQNNKAGLGSDAERFVGVGRIASGCNRMPRVHPVFVNNGSRTFAHVGGNYI
jgi:hypothetical protein